MSANSKQVGGQHYAKHGDLQHWDIVAKFNLDYFQGQITKYVMRWKDKNGVQDLEKAAHFLEKYIELVKEVETIDKILGDPVVEEVSEAPAHLTSDAGSKCAICHEIITSEGRCDC